MLFKGNSSSLQLIIEKLQSNKEHNTKDPPGSEGAASWGSEERTASPGSACATPNSTTEAPDSEISFTVGVTDGTPHACRFCDKAFPKQSYLKKHEQSHADYMPFRCEYCRRLFKHKRSRDRHIKLHTGDRKYKCSQCEAAFSRSDHLKIHMKTHDHQKPFQCTVCNRGYNTAAALTSHMQNHKRSSETFSIPGPPGTTFKCLQCSEIFRKPEELQNHMNSHPVSDTISNSGGRTKSSSYLSIRLTCKYCTKDNFATMELLRSHVQSVHKSVANGAVMTNNGKPSTSNSLPPQSLNSSPSYYCDLCTMRFTSLQALKKHTASMHAGFSSAEYNSPKFLSMPPESINSGKLDCVYCSTHFFTPAAFAEHFLVFHAPYHPHLLGFTPPEQIKPTDLSVGSKTSPRKRSTTRDEQMSSSPKKRYKTINSTIPPNNPYRYNYAGALICNQCLAAFADFQSFRAHIKLHIEGTNGGLLGGAKPTDCKRTPIEHMCPHCWSVFSSAEEASQHVVGHFLASTIGYSCENCNRAFTKANELKEHLMDVHARVVYNCSICNEMFDSMVTIQMHFTSKHSTEMKVYSCTGCPATKANIYHSESELATHVRSIHSHISFNNDRTAQATTCLICQMTFSNALDMQLHLSTHAKQFHCTICMQSFPVEYLLDKHIQTHHSPSPNSNNDEDSGVKNLSPRQSPGSGYNSPIKKEQNEETRANNFECSNDKDFSNVNESMARKKVHGKQKSPGWSFNASSNKIEEDRGALSLKSKSNSSIHTSPITVKTETFNGSDNRLTNCDICTKSEFTFETELQSRKKLLHRQGNSSSIHCPECRTKFDNITAFEIHLATVHRKNYQCTKCQATFDNANEIQRHVATHLMNGHECRLCRTELPTPSQLQAHLIEHNFAGCAAFGCYLCQSVFPTAQTLQIHILEHGLSARPYDCNRCNEKFFFSSELEHHNYVHLGEMATNEDHSRSRLNRSASEEEEENESAVVVKDECIPHNDYDSEDEQIDVVTTKSEDKAKQND